jgi:hypothetical protein
MLRLRLPLPVLRAAASMLAVLLAPGCGEEAAALLASDAPPRGVYQPIAITNDPSAETIWQGRRWRVNAGPVFDPQTAYAIQTDPDQTRIRFELRNSPQDRSPRDDSDTRRAELSGSLRGDLQRLPNGTMLWGAMQFRHHAWPDPAGMKALTGGVYGQIHMGSRFGGSPALAFRRNRDGLFVITTRGQYDPQGTTHFAGAVAFDVPHDLVYRIVLHPTSGSLSVWLDGKRIVARERISIGHEYAESYWNFGLYFSGGIAGRVSAEYAGHVYPAPADLGARAASPVSWPR